MISLPTKSNALLRFAFLHVTTAAGLAFDCFYVATSLGNASIAFVSFRIYRAKKVSNHALAVSRGRHSTTINKSAVTGILVQLRRYTAGYNEHAKTQTMVILITTTTKSLLSH